MKIGANGNRIKTGPGKIDELVKSPKFRHAPAFAGAGSAKAGIQNYLKTLDSRLRGNDAKGRFKTFNEAIKIDEDIKPARQQRMRRYRREKVMSTPMLCYLRRIYFVSPIDES